MVTKPPKQPQPATAERQTELHAALLSQILCHLRSLREPMTTGELMGELTVIRRTGVVELPPIKEETVTAALQELYQQGKVEETPCGVWHFVQTPGVKEPRQKPLFE